TRIEDNSTEIETIQARIAERRAELEQAETGVEDVEAGETELDSAYEEAKEAQEGLEAERTALQEQQAQTATELSSAKARAEALRLGTALEAHLGHSVHAGRPGVGAAVTERLSVTTGFEMAVAAALSTTVSGVIVDSGDVALSVLDHLGEDTNVSLTIPTGVSADPSVQAGGEVGARAAAGKGGNASHALPDPDALPDPANLPDADAEAGPLRWLCELVDSDVPELQRLLAQAPHAVVCVPDPRTGMALTAARPELTAVTVHGEVLSTTRVSRARTAS